MYGTKKKNRNKKKHQVGTEYFKLNRKKIYHLHTYDMTIWYKKRAGMKNLKNNNNNYEHNRRKR